MKLKLMGTEVIVLAVAMLLAWSAWPVSAQGTYTITDLGTLPGRAKSYGTGLNGSGAVVGNTVLSNGINNSNAFVWQDGIMSAIPTFSGTGSSLASSINGNGEVAGFASSKDGNRAFLWRNGQLIDLTPKAPSHANALNDNSQVVGAIYTQGSRPFLWQNNAWNYLPVLNNVKSSRSEATAINNAPDRGLVPGERWHTASRSLERQYHYPAASAGRIFEQPGQRHQRQW